MFTREAPTMTLKEARDQIDDKSVTVSCSTTSIKLDLTKDRTISFGDAKPVEVEATPGGITAIGNLVNVPTAFLHRLDADMQQVVLAGLLKKQPGLVLVKHNRKVISEVFEPKSLVIDPRRLLDIAMDVIDPLALVVEMQRDATEFRCDVIVPEGFDRGIGGDKPTGRKVGDISRGGIRFGVDHKHHLTPWVAQYVYRLICTNGMEVLDEVYKIDGRGSSAEEVMDDFALQTERAFKAVDNVIKAFYDLRTQKVANPERVILRIANEHKLPDGVRDYLLEVAAELPDPTTMFDVVNLITNQANDLSVKAGTRRRLERLGGFVVTEHAARCGHCQARLN